LRVWAAAEPNRQTAMETHATNFFMIVLILK
jgi:hypothetical protein